MCEERTTGIVEVEMSEVVVVARARAKEGREQDLMRAFDDVIPPTHEEGGCQRYALHRGTDDPRLFVMIERWDSRADLDRHLGTAHVQKLFGALPDLIDGAPELMILENVSAATGDKGALR